ncbi:MAG: tetratricopeptide repeat protein [Akkermansiaceae bacterium]|nr:tetratricopeptide repeat protein [Akkermansiaceae bacterium]
MKSQNKHPEAKLPSDSDEKRADRSERLRHLDTLGLPATEAEKVVEPSLDSLPTAADDAMPAIHDDRIGSKTFVPNVALELYEIAAQQGDAQAQYSLGLCYHYGEGTLKDPFSAFKWFSQAAEGGHAQAQYSVGVYYQQGIGTEQNSESAFKWFEKAAIQNQPKAQHELGESFYHGRGVEKNPAMAKKWINKSYVNGNKRASESWDNYELWKF